MSCRAYVGLVHHPVLGKKGEIITTSVTNLDIHDISRSCKTFGVERFFIVTPIHAQKELVGRILSQWEEESFRAFNPHRGEALALTKLVDNLEELIEQIESIEGQRPLVVTTSACFSEGDGDELDLKEKIRLDNKPMLLLFGTGHGLADEVVEMSHYRLHPLGEIENDNDYNHLSVRSAVAIYLDRLFRLERKKSNKN